MDTKTDGGSAQFTLDLQSYSEFHPQQICLYKDPMLFNILINVP